MLHEKIKNLNFSITIRLPRYLKNLPSHDCCFNFSSSNKDTIHVSKDNLQYDCVNVTHHLLNMVFSFMQPLL